METQEAPVSRVEPLVASPRLPRRTRWVLAAGLAPVLLAWVIFALTSTGSRSPSRASATHTLAFTGVGKDIVWLAVIGGVLVLIGGALLLSLDAPRRVLRKLSLLHLSPPSPEADEATGHTSAFDRVRTFVKWDSLSAITRPRRHGQELEGDTPPGPSVAAYRGLPPGWYRDDSDFYAARYWDGSTLGETTRPITPTSSAGPPPSPVVAFVGLSPGWYRDDEDPTQARYWDGTTLGDERRAVQPSS